MDRRLFLSGLAGVGVGCGRRVRAVAPVGLRLAPVRAEVERIFRVTVCVRPFRAAGPRMDVERVGEKTVVHHYGHGGSGWSLSWGAGALAVEKAMALGEKNVAVVGCGAMGLTAAILLQRAGARVTIYAKERPPEVRSARATGSWTPDSRIALANSVSPEFPALWERMARTSFKMYESYLGLAGNPVEWSDRYFIEDGGSAPGPAAEGGLEFARYMGRIRDITPRSREMAPGTHPFGRREVRQTAGLTFNIASYARTLMNDFFVAGGRMETVEFRAPGDLAGVAEKVIVNATGYGARALWKDESLVPVRGQIAWLIPQAEVNYGLMYKGVFVLGRRDGIVVQGIGAGEMEGYNNADETPDRGAAEAVVRTLADLYGAG